MSVVGVVLAGGAGTRLAPISTPETPKQFLPLVDGIPGCEAALRLLARSGTDELAVITNSRALAACQKVLMELPASITMRTTTLVESHPVGTFFSYMLAVHNVLPETVLIVTPSDHWIADKDAMIGALRQAVPLAVTFEGIILIGEAAMLADPAVGYVRVASPFAKGTVSKLVEFIQRPGLERAMRLVNGDEPVFWNTGITVARASVWRRLALFMHPELQAALKTAQRIVAGTVRFDTRALALASEPVGIDEAVIARRTSPVWVLPVQSGWHDIGTPAGLARARLAAGEPEAAEA